jgi:GDPmannose 4,6-dehydratase
VIEKKRAFITGITGQDGFYLSEFLLSKGYGVYGLVRKNSASSLTDLDELKTKGELHILYGDINDLITLRKALTEARPDEIYNLAAQSKVSTSFELSEETMKVNFEGLKNLIKEAVSIDPHVKIYQASTSEMFGNTKPPQNEQSTFAPVSPYGKSKLKAHELVQQCRERGVFICSGILFNHESPRRGEHFVTRKISMSLAKIKLGMQDHLELGNLDAKRDWGFAGDYVKAMWMMLQQDTPDDFVISTGEGHSVREFVDRAAEVLSLPIVWEGSGLEEIGKDENGKTIIKINKDFYRPAEINYTRGNSTKAKKILGWKPTVSFGELVKMMIDFDLKLLNKDLSSK